MNKEQQIEKDRLIQIEEIDELIREKFHGQVYFGHKWNRKPEYVQWQIRNGRNHE